MSDDGIEILRLQEAVAKAQALEEKQRSALALLGELKAVLVRQLVHKQHPRLSITEERTLMRSYGVEPPR